LSVSLLVTVDNNTTTSMKTPIKDGDNTAAVSALREYPTATAYDYDKQCWVTGAEAVRVRLGQVRCELEILRGPSGAEYAQFAGGDRAEMLGRFEAELAELEGKAAPVVGQVPGIGIMSGEAV
jgi:hypothetical protein